MRFPAVQPALSLYTIFICLVAAMLYVAANKIEPNSRDAAGLKILIIGLLARRSSLI
jgi:hypothetical protein